MKDETNVFLTDSDLKDIGYFFASNCGLGEVEVTPEGLRVNQDSESTLRSILKSLLIFAFDKDDPEPNSEGSFVGCNMTLLSRCVHYLKIMFPLYEFEFASDEANEFLDQWERARGYKITGKFNEVYRAGLYEIALSFGAPKARQVAA